MKKILIPLFITLSLVNPLNAQPCKEVIKANNQKLSKNQKINYCVDKYSKQYKVNKYLVHAIIKTESNYNPNSVSKDGAIGLMQLRPVTAKARGCKNPYNIDDNVKAGTKHIAGLLAKYDGNERLAIAAYNAGGGAVDKYGGVPPFPETRHYVKKILTSKKMLEREKR